MEKNCPWHMIHAMQGSDKDLSKRSAMNGVIHNTDKLGTSYPYLLKEPLPPSYHQCICSSRDTKHIQTWLSHSLGLAVLVHCTSTQTSE